jgi:hypothetical protein
LSLVEQFIDPQIHHSPLVSESPVLASPPGIACVAEFLRANLSPGLAKRPLQSAFHSISVKA